MSARILIVSNRLPVTVRASDDGVTVSRSPGGLATGLRGPHERSGGLWIGWPGDLEGLDDAQRGRLDQELADLRYLPVLLSRREIAEYYSEVSNGVIWPLFHYLLDRVPVDAAHWGTYRAVNERFADAVVERYEHGDLIWVHDYHLLLLPALIRSRIPDARIGFFLHIPFPSSEVFRIFPWREEVLRGLLGADLIGFHTFAYARHFASSLLRVLGVEPQVDRIWYEGREVRIGPFPLGIDAADFASKAASAPVQEAVARIRADNDGQQVLMGIDRLDYTKGVPRRLLALERLLELEPSLIGRVRLVQIGVPTRTDSRAYVRFRRQVEEAVSRINGRFSTVSWSPITYLYRSLPELEVIELYLSADVMLVTALRDGLNLVAKEFCACRIDDDGVLVLSEFAGAAAELGEALLCNPFDIDGLARTMHRALTLPVEERHSRMRALRERVAVHHVYRWVDTFLSALEQAGNVALSGPRRVVSSHEIGALAREARAGGRLVALLDYDGTLVPFTVIPELARPDEEVVRLLRELATCPEVEVHVVSGRSHASLEAWLGELPIGLYAEHGFWARPGPGAPWAIQIDPVEMAWKEQVRPILEQFSERTPGSFVEEKSASLVWHYRAVEAEFGALQARELRLHLAEALSNLPVQVIPGSRIVEVRLAGIHKGLVAARVLGNCAPPCTLLAVGDDRTDEDLFVAMPPESFTIRVGPGPTVARYRLPSLSAVRSLLAALAAG